ncbi:MAG: hypothetical protein J6K12_07110 [Clostridia bacterium]|nr:hypothetical protein [Clostridia bacterium]
MNIKNTISYILSSVVVAAIMTVAVFADGESILTRNYLTEKYYNEEEKLATMGIEDQQTGERKPNYENDEYEIWALEETGEVGIRVKSTGQILLTNPYNVGESTANEDVKKRLLSQIIIQYRDNSGAVVDFNTFADAAQNSNKENNVVKKQIIVKNIRNGIRVEYTLGKEQAKYVVPRQISQYSFENNIIAEWEDKSTRDYEQFVAYYDLKDPFDPDIAPNVLNSMRVQWPITEKMAIYVLDPGVSNRELELLASYLENNTKYDAEQMEADYEEVGYLDTSAAPALFRFAIEYSLDEYGIQISMPATSIKYDTSNYKLESVKLLPYFNAGVNDNEGFTLLPDGSGTITRFEDIKGKSFTLTGKLYGKDYAYHSISGYTQETMRIPAFGLLETAPFVPTPEEKEADEDEVVEDEMTETDAEVAQDEENTLPDEATEDEVAVDGEEAVQGEEETEQEIIEQEVAEPEQEYRTKGFVAYYTEGDSMSEFTSDHGGTVHNYSSVYATFYPRQTDTYALTSISSTGDAQWTIGSDRRYTGDYTFRVFPIYGEGTSYTDMAAEIRNYLEATGVLTKLDPEAEKNDDVPLYLETFGTIKTKEKVVGFPVERQTPLTTFEQTEQIITELKEAGIENINIKLTGWYNGGMEHTAPAKLKVPSSIGGKKGLKNLISFAKEQGVGIYPDLDFTYVEFFSSFDGVSTKNDTAKTMDGRSAVHRIYNALYQGFEADDKAVISPVAMLEFYENIEKKYNDLGADAISLASIGSDLNSDFNNDYALNRDECMKIIDSFLQEVSADNANIMVDCGNAYTLKYADHVLNVPLDSSMNINTSQSIPFMGMVLHGYTEFTGPAINLDGDFDYSVLKAIENGAGLYFLVSKDNTSELKVFPEFSKYYAIKYDNWKPDIIDTYTLFNESMKTVKYATISDHEYIGTRIVRVEYDNGVEFILNYNTHEAVLEDGTTVGAMSFAVR